MPRCKYRYYVTLLPCKQFHLGATGGHSSYRGRIPLLATPYKLQTLLSPR